MIVLLLQEWEDANDLVSIKDRSLSCLVVLILHFFPVDSADFSAFHLLSAPSDPSLAPGRVFCAFYSMSVLMRHARGFFLNSDLRLGESHKEVFAYGFLPIIYIRSDRPFQGLYLQNCGKVTFGANQYPHAVLERRNYSERSDIKDRPVAMFVFRSLIATSSSFVSFSEILPMGNALVAPVLPSSIFTAK